jgi:hypothetical protein
MLIAAVLFSKKESSTLPTQNPLLDLPSNYPSANLKPPGIIAKKSEIIRHNEPFLIRRYVGYIFKKDKSVDKKIERNKTIKAFINQTEIELKFDLAWVNGSTNLVKPLSFDLSDEQSTQNKSTKFFGYLNLLTDYAKANNLRFDFLVSKSQNNDLIGSYESALYILELAKAPKGLSQKITYKTILKKQYMSC